MDPPMMPPLFSGIFIGHRISRSPDATRNHSPRRCCHPLPANVAAALKQPPSSPHHHDGCLHATTNPPLAAVSHHRNQRPHPSIVSLPYCRRPKSNSQPHRHHDSQPYPKSNHKKKNHHGHQSLRKPQSSPPLPSHLPIAAATQLRRCCCRVASLQSPPISIVGKMLWCLRTNIKKAVKRIGIGID